MRINLIMFLSVAFLVSLAGEQKACAGSSGPVCQYAQSKYQTQKTCGDGNVVRELYREYLIDTDAELAKMGERVAHLFYLEYLAKHAEGSLDQDRQQAPNRDGRLPRVTHSKSHGCAKAIFTVGNSLPADLRIAPFAEPGTSYKAWVRFANGTSFVKTDDVPDARAMSFKLLGVDGEKLFHNDPNSKAFDFVMNNAPVFFVKSPQDFVNFFERAFPPTPAYRWVRVNHPDVFKNLFIVPFFLMRSDEAKALSLLTAAERSPINLLNEKFYSGIAIRWGNKAVKYSAVPKTCAGETRSSNVADLWQKSEGATETFFETTHRRVLERQLNRDRISACWDIQIQVQTDPWLNPIEDTTLAWPDNPEATYTVGELRMDPQSIDNPKKLNFCDGLQFSPWRVTESFKPLGGLARLRYWAYYFGSQRRQELNTKSGYYSTRPSEPTGDESFED